MFTTRRGGISDGAYATLNLGLTGAEGEPRDDPEHVHANRRLLADQVGIPWERVARGRQVHGTTVHRVDDPLPSAMAERVARPGDGQATALPGVGALVLVADCLPIALATPGAVAMIHAGWRGLAGGVLARGIEKLREAAAEKAQAEQGDRGDDRPAGASPSTAGPNAPAPHLAEDIPVAAAIGPGIGRCCYEVGDEVRRAFGPLAEPATEDRRLDLKLIARHQLQLLGVTDVHDVGLCTACSDPSLFFSHRRDRGVTGRQCGIAWRC